MLEQKFARAAKGRNSPRPVGVGELSPPPRPSPPPPIADARARAARELTSGVQNSRFLYAMFSLVLVCWAGGRAARAKQRVLSPKNERRRKSSRDAPGAGARRRQRPSAFFEEGGAGPRWARIRRAQSQWGPRAREKQGWGGGKAGRRGTSLQARVGDFRTRIRTPLFLEEAE